MKYFTVFLFLSIQIFAQETFNKAIHFQSIDTCETPTVSSEIGKSVLAVEDGYIISGGGWADEFCGWSSIKLWKTDLLGNVVWQKVYGKEYYLHVDGLYGHLIETHDGNYAICGGIADSTNLANPFLIKFDDNGDTLWLKEYGGEHWDTFYRGIATPDNGFILVGITESFGNGNPATNSHDVYVVRTDSMGNELWHETYLNGFDDFGASIALRKEGGYAIGGSRISSGVYRTFFLSIDSVGNTEKLKMYGSPIRDNCWANITAAKDGGFIMNSCTGRDHNIPNYDEFAPPYVAKLDAEGNLEWRYYVSLDYQLNIVGSRELEDGSILAVGWWAEQPFAFPYGLILKLSADGKLIWKKYIQYEPNGVNYFYDFQETSDKGFILTGATTNWDNGTADVWLVKLNEYGCFSEGVCDSLTTNIEVLDASEMPLIHLFPNPVKDYLQFRWSPSIASKPIQLQMTNIEGRLVKEEWLRGGDGLNVSDLEVGIYFVTCLQEGQVLKREKVIIGY
ncbi:MAG: T9SS type A sorting domain-containing protein [Chitinophagales bacterium]